MTTTSRRRRLQSFKKLVSLWAGLIKEHGLPDFAGAIALQALVAVFSLLFLGLAVLGALGKQSVWDNQIAPQIHAKVLEPVFGGIDATVQKIFQGDSTGLIVFAALLAVWEVAGMVRVCMRAFSRIYGGEDDRPWTVRYPISLGISVVLTATLVLFVLLIAAYRSSVHGVWEIPYSIARWLLAIGLLVVGFGILVRFAPVERRAKRWATGGAMLVVVGWTVQSLLFYWYAHSLANYRSVFGGLLLALFVTTYLFVGAIVLLVGIELDEQLRKDVQGDEERGIVDLVRGIL